MENLVYNFQRFLGSRCHPEAVLHKEGNRQKQETEIDCQHPRSPLLAGRGWESRKLLSENPMFLEVLVPKDTVGYLNMRASYASHKGYLLSSTLQVKGVPNRLA